MQQETERKGKQLLLGDINEKCERIWGDQRGALGRAILTAPTAARGVHGAGAWRGGRERKVFQRKVFQATYPACSSMRIKNKLSHQDCLPSQERKMVPSLIFHCTVSKYLCSQSACSLVLLPFLVKFSCHLPQCGFWKPYRTSCMVLL